MEAIKLCRLDTPIIFIEARINLSRFVVTGCAAKTSATNLLKFIDRKSGSAGMPRPISYAVFCSKINMPELKFAYRLKITILFFVKTIDFFNYKHYIYPRIYNSTLFTYTTLFRSVGYANHFYRSAHKFEQICRHRLRRQNVGNKSAQIYRSEERFSRNAETDIVCRLLLENKYARTKVCL